ncbi:zinc finger, CCHC-type containing protein [Tanacetum coccineum]
MRGSHWSKPTRIDTRIRKEAHQEVGFYTELLVKEAQRGLTHGMPRWQSVCSLNDPTVIIEDPMIGNDWKVFSMVAAAGLRQVRFIATCSYSIDVCKNIMKSQGCKAVVRLLDPKLKTLGERGIECIFVGYVEHSKAFWFYVIEPNNSVAIHSIIESRDAIFDEKRFSLILRSSLRIPNGTNDIGGSVVPEEVTEEDDPKTFDKAMNSQDVAFWKEAINDEMDFIMGNNTWVLADLPLVARISTIRLLIAMASIHNLIIHQLDVKTAFLNGKLEEGVYMNQPQGFIMYGNENNVCKLIKSLYGLKRAPKQWHQKFDEVVLSNGYLLNQADKSVYSKFDETGKKISCMFSMKDMGEADVILGKRIKHESNVLTISQSHYIEKVLKKFNYFECTPVSTLMDTSEKLMPYNGQVVSQLEYSRVIGCLMYAMTCIRPDIAFAMEGYTDTSWISNTEDNSSTSGWVFLPGGGVLSWASKKQTCITGSIMESEFVALAAAGKEAEWLKNLLLEIPLWSKPTAPIYIRCDSAATLAKTFSQMYNGNSRHLGSVPDRVEFHGSLNVYPAGYGVCR